MKPWEPGSPHRECARCGCGYSVHFEGDDFYCDVCLWKLEAEAREDEEACDE